MLFIHLSYRRYSGLSVAECVQKVYGGTGMKRIMIMCGNHSFTLAFYFTTGPGSNGGDGLVAGELITEQH